jgi:phosphatidate cytidylyltransferase
MNNLIVRALTGAVFALLVLGAIFLDDRIASLMFGAFMLIGIIEFYKLFEHHKEVEIDWRLGTFFVILVYGIGISAIYQIIPAVFIYCTAPLIFILALTELWRRKKNPILNVAVLFMGAFYIGYPFYLLTVTNLTDSPTNWTDIENTDVFFRMPITAVLILLVWTNDTFAYLIGRLLGKKKLFERISPNKTWEGTIGGITFSVLLGVVFGLYTNNGNDFIYWIVCALIIAACAIFGDLFQSMMKRSLNIKDSGSLLPGHGGILDRFDALLFAVPFFVAWTWIYNYL